MVVVAEEVAVDEFPERPAILATAATACCGKLSSEVLVTAGVGVLSPVDDFKCAGFAGVVLVCVETVIGDFTGVIAVIIGVMAFDIAATRGFVAELTGADGTGEVGDADSAGVGAVVVVGAGVDNAGAVAPVTVLLTAFPADEITDPRPSA
jgi:hypothetical protein